MSGANSPHSSSPSSESPLLRELKVRARLRLKALRGGDAVTLAHAERFGRRRRWVSPSRWRLHQALHLVAADCGFEDWLQAKSVLGGTHVPQGDHGAFWYTDGCGAFLNHWFADYDEARACLAAGPDRGLYPYRRQYVVADGGYAEALGLTPQAMRGRDLVQDYGTPFWHERCRERLARLRGG